MVEWILDRLFDDALGFGGGEAILGLALEFRLAHKYREHHCSTHHDVFRRDRGAALALSDALGVILQAAQQCTAHARFVRAAIRRRHRVAVGGEKAVSIRRPCHRPFAAAMAPLRPDLPEKISGCTSVSA